MNKINHEDIFSGLYDFIGDLSQQDAKSLFWELDTLGYNSQIENDIDEKGNISDMIFCLRNIKKRE